MFRWQAAPGLEVFPPRSHTGRVLIGLVVGAAAAALRATLTFTVGTGVAFLLAYPSVLIAALLGGMVGGLTATVVSLIAAAYMWLPPIGSLYIASLADRVSAVIFTLSGILMTLLVSHMHTLRARVERDRTLMQLAQKVARFGTYIFDATTGEVSWSAGMYDLYGVPAGSPLNLRQWLNRIRPDDRDRVEA